MENIKSMSKILTQSNKILQDLEKNISEREKNFGDFEKLKSYYGSDSWHQDRENKNISGEQRYVLSEDGIYDCLTKTRDLAKKIQKLAKKYEKKVLE